jgi:hypothetical protein
MHLLLIVVAVGAVVVWTSHLAYPTPLRVSLAVVAGVLGALTVFGRLPLGLGPAAGTVAAGAVRVVGVVLAGAGVAVVVLGLTRSDSPDAREPGGVPLAGVLLSVYLGAFLAVTRRDGGLPSRTMLTGVGLGLVPAALFAGAVPILPPELVWWWGFLLIVAAALGSGWLTRSGEIAVPAGLLTMATAGQTLFFAAAVLYHYGPDSWMPYAGPGPLTPQGQLEQNRAEAIDPYVGLLFLGGVAAAVLTVQALTAWRRSLGGSAVPVGPQPAG